MLHTHILQHHILLARTSTGAIQHITAALLLHTLTAVSQDSASTEGAPAEADNSADAAEADNSADAAVADNSGAAAEADNSADAAVAVAANVLERLNGLPQPSLGDRVPRVAFSERYEPPAKKGSSSDAIQ